MVARQMVDPMGNGKFLYAILERPAQDELHYPGLHQAPLELVRYRDLAAVASTIDVEQFAGADEARLTADLVCYQQVNAALLRQ
jgi:Gas vesicle synthesis protein GvpL/GvpF